MSERWNLQFRNGLLFGVAYVIAVLVMSPFADSKKEELSELITHPNFYLKWLIWFLIGMFIIGYCKWKFPLRDENRIEKQFEKEDNKGNMWNYIVNSVAFFVFLLGLLLNLDELLVSFSFKKIFFNIIFFSLAGIIVGYIEWKNVDGRYNSWSYVFRNIKRIFKRI